MENVLYVAALLIFAFLLTLHIILSHSVKKHSELFICVMELNRKYKTLFQLVQSVYHVNYTCTSLQQLRNRNNIETMTNYLCGLMKERGSSWYAIYEKMEANKKHLREYNSEYKTLISSLAGNSYDKVKNHSIMSEDQYKRLEVRMCNRRKPPIAITEVSIICEVIYTTPKGTKSYSAQRKIEMSAIFDRIKYQSEAEQSIKYQRSLMTASKRYDIMRRDGFRCKLCGRSADDGANLEVDHILAVSRGGKSTDNNLRTLCRECNQGKKAKLE